MGGRSQRHGQRVRLDWSECPSARATLLARPAGTEASSGRSRSGALAAACSVPSPADQDHPPARLAAERRTSHSASSPSVTTASAGAPSASRSASSSPAVGGRVGDAARAAVDDHEQPRTPASVRSVSLDASPARPRPRVRRGRFGLRAPVADRGLRGAVGVVGEGPAARRDSGLCSDLLAPPPAARLRWPRRRPPVPRRSSRTS